MDKKEQKKEIKELLAVKKYLEICRKYGIDPFYHNTTKKQRNKIMKQMIKEKNIVDMYEVFNEKDVQYGKQKIQDIEKRDSSKHKVIASVKYTKDRFIHSDAKHIPVYILIAYITFNSLMSGAITYYGEKQKDQDALDHFEEIWDYENNIYDYAEYINTLNLSDMEVIVKVMSDMWENIGGYGAPEDNLAGYYALGVDEAGEYGVCRNMADDMARKLNKINPEYNARLLLCDLGEGNIDMLGIERNIKDNGGVEEDKDLFDKYLTKVLAANHAVVAMDIPGEDVTIIVDATNPSIGIIANQQVVMFNTLYDENDKEITNPADYTYKLPADMELNDGRWQNLMAIYKSTFISSSKIDELNKIYGIKAQQKAYESVQEIDDQEYVHDTFYSTKK